MRKSVFAYGLLVVLMIAGSAMADFPQIKAKFLGDYGTQGKLYLDGSSAVNPNTTYLIGISQFSNVTNPANPTTFWGFCIDLAQTISADGVIRTWDVRPSLEGAPFPGGLIDEGKADLIAELWNEHYIGTEGVWTTSVGTGRNDTNAAAFQMALWNIIYDGDASVSSGSGSFYTSSTGTWVDRANDWLSHLGDGNSDASLLALTNANTQDFAILGTGFGATIPAPAAIVLGMLGLGLVGWTKTRSA